MQKALEDAERCISLRPTWEKGYFRKGSVLEGLNRLEEALGAYREAAEYNPKNPEVANKIKSLSKMLRNSRNAQGRKASEEAKAGGGVGKASAAAATGGGGFVKNDEEYAKAKANAVSSLPETAAPSPPPTPPVLLRSSSAHAPCPREPLPRPHPPCPVPASSTPGEIFLGASG